MFHAGGKRRRVSNRPYVRVGYVGKKANAAGKVDDTITLYVPAIETKRFTLVTDSSRIINNATVMLQDNNGTPLTQYNIIDNAAARLDFELPCTNIPHSFKYNEAYGKPQDMAYRLLSRF